MHLPGHSLCFRPDEVFATNTDLAVQVYEIGRTERPIVIVDDFYREPLRVRELVLTAPAPIWKTQPGGRNFVDYYDCRQRWASIGGPWVPAVRAVVQAGFDQPAIHSIDEDFISNLFWLLGEQHGQPHPHNDNASANLLGFTAVITLNTDDEAAGGTAFYRYRDLELEYCPLGADFASTLERVCQPPNVEDGRSYFNREFDTYWERMHMVPMRFNRLLIFPSNLWHGAWHPVGAFRDYPRINQVVFVNADRGSTEDRAPAPSEKPRDIVRFTLLRDQARIRSQQAVAHSLERLHAYRAHTSGAHGSEPSNGSERR